MHTAKSDPANLSRHWPVQLTRTGLFYLLLTGFVLAAAVNSGVNLLHFAFGMMIGALFVSLFIGSWSLRRIQITRDIGDHLIAGEPLDVVYSFRNGKPRCPAFAVRFREIHPALTTVPQGFIFHLPAAHATPVKVATRLTAANRGILKLSTLELSTSFPFGLIRRTRRIAVPQEVVVYPRIGLLNRHLAHEYREAVESGAMTSNRRGGNDEFYGVREYRSGDNVRIIHWRSTARAGRPMIREMAANAPPQLIIVLNLRAAAAASYPDAIERAVELAAALVCYGFYENFAVGMAIAGLPDSPAPAPRLGRDCRAQMLHQLAILDPAKIQPNVGIRLPNRVAGRAQWVIVTLNRNDPTRDLLPPGQSPQLGPNSGTGTTHRTLLSMDATDAPTWIRFLSHEETLRLLRERETN